MDLKSLFTFYQKVRSQKIHGAAIAAFQREYYQKIKKEMASGDEQRKMSRIQWATQTLKEISELPCVIERFKDPGGIKRLSQEMAFVVRARIILWVIEEPLWIQRRRPRNRMILWLLERELFDLHHELRLPPQEGLFRFLMRRLAPPEAVVLWLREIGLYWIPTRRLMEHLVTLLTPLEGPILEVGAGSGFFSRQLRAFGVSVRVTDNYSWSNHVPYNPAEVEQIDAAAALKRYSPSVVLTCWSPPGNQYEAQIFKTRSVRHVLAIGPCDGLRSGSPALDHPTGFKRVCLPDVAQCILPEGVGNQVIHFARLP